MLSIIQIFGVALGLSSIVAASPTGPRLNERALEMYKVSTRQAAGSTLTDIDILQLYAYHKSTSAFSAKSMQCFNRRELGDSFL